MSYIGNQPLSSAFVTDQFSGNGSTVAFTMSVAPANTSSVLVAVSGVMQDPSTYSVNGLTLTFSQAPPAGTGNISVRYLGVPASGVTTTAYRTVTEFTASSGQTTFTPPSYTVGYINVYRNGVRLSPSDYTASNGTTVVLLNSASAGDTVVTESFYVSSVLNAIPATANSISTPYLIDASVTQAKLGAGVAGNGPAFSAYLSTSQAFTSGVTAKIAFNAKEFDTANCFDSTTNNRFTPNIAGYYSFNVWLNSTSSTTTRWIIWIYKNGSAYKVIADSNATTPNCLTASSVMAYANGSTDYFEVYTYIAGTSPAVYGSGISTASRFEGFLARAA